MSNHRSKIIGDAPCPSCRAEGRDSTGNHLILFADGGGYCNRCGYTQRGGDKAPTNSDMSEVVARTPARVSIPMSVLTSINELPSVALPLRGLRKHTLEHFQVRCALSQQDGSTVTDIYYPIHKSKNLTGYHHRQLPKEFNYIGDCKGADLWGLHAANAGKTLYVTEGREDAMAVWQALTDHSNLDGWNPAVVSIGGTHAHTALADHMDVLEQYEKIVLLMDNDEPGREAAAKACQIFPEKTYIVEMDLKDPNDYLMAGRAEDLKWLAMKPKKYQPDNVISGSETWDIYLNSSKDTCYPYPEQWSELNNKTYGVRLGSVVTIASGSGSGKSQFMRELKYHYLRTTNFKMADMALEESIQDTVGGMLALHLNKRISLPDVQVTEEELKSAHDYVYGSDRFTIYDHFGGMDDDSLFTRLRYFAATGHQMIFLDHLSIVVSEYASEGDERKRIDVIMTRLAKLAKEFNIIIFLIVHLKKSSGFGPSFEEGAKPSLDDLRGSGSIKQLSWDVIFLTRNQQHPEAYCANTSLITVGKCRFSGRTGDADYLHFDQKTGRMVRVSAPPGWDLEKLKKEQKRSNF